MEKIDVVLGAGLEGYGVVKYANEICMSFKDAGHDVRLIALENKKYYRPDAFPDVEAYSLKHKRADAYNFIVSLPYDEEHMSKFSDIFDMDYSSIFFVDRNRERAKLQFDSIDGIERVRAVVSFDDFIISNIDKMASVEYIFDEMVIFGKSYNDNHKKFNLAAFTGRNADYKRPMFAVKSFYHSLQNKNWSYVHLADVDHEFVIESINRAKILFYGSNSGHANEPVIENSLLEGIASGCKIIVPNKEYMTNLIERLGVGEDSSLFGYMKMHDMVSNIDLPELSDRSILEQFSRESFYNKFKHLAS